MFYPGVTIRKRNWGIIKRLRPGGKSFALTALALIISITRMMKLGMGEGRSAQGMSDPPSQLIGQE
jgi:hypothetical protein